MATILKDKIVKTRKDHICHGCAEKFDKGTKLKVVTAVDGGDIGTTYWCRVCEVTYQENVDYDCQIGLGDAKEWDSWHDNNRQIPRTW